VRVSREART